MSLASRSICEDLRYLIRLWRMGELWDKLLLVSGCAGLLLIHSGMDKASVSEWAFYVAAVLFLLIGGYTINAVADFAQDSRSGKNAIEPAPRWSHSLASGVAAITIGMFLIGKATHGVLPLAIAGGTVLLGVEYSLPPIRFKESGIWGIVIGALTQRPMIFLIWTAALDAWNTYTLVLACWLFSGGMAGMLGHQVLDRSYDQAGRVRSFVLQKGLRLTSRLGVACGIVMALATLAPFAMMPKRQALLHAGVLAAMLSVYTGKGLRLLRQTWRAGSLQRTAFPG
jgi:4-hydroxybenzoate polyprenyltransferase